MPQIKITKSALQRIIKEELGYMMGEEESAPAPAPDGGGSTPELADLERMLGQHDWTYQYSDDHYSWSKGSKEEDAINAKVRELGAKDKALGEKAIKMYQAYAKKYLNRG